MAFNTQKSSFVIVNLQYSATLGMLFEASKQNLALLDQVKAAIGDADWKKGYQGPNSEAVKTAKTTGLVSGDVEGVLTSVYIDNKPVDGRTERYLKVGLKDGGTRFFISIAIGSEAAQKLARKLAAAEIGVKTQISLFAFYGKKEGAARAYASHGASVKQGGREVTGVDPQTSLVPIINTALDTLKTAGIDDKETLGKHRQKVTANWHVELIGKLEERVKAHYKAHELPAASSEDIPHPSAEADYWNDPSFDEHMLAEAEAFAGQ